MEKMPYILATISSPQAMVSVPGQQNLMGMRGQCFLRLSTYSHPETLQSMVTVNLTFLGPRNGEGFGARMFAATST